MRRGIITVVSGPFDKLKALREQLPPGTPPVEAPSPTGLEGKLVVRHERKGRAGKTVTVVSGVALAGPALEAFVRDAKAALGCGGAIEDGALVLQGDLVERAAAWLEARGARKVVRGN